MRDHPDMSQDDPTKRSSFTRLPVGVELLIRHLSIRLRRIRRFLRTHYRWYYQDR
ncbi:hypothetical protein [Nitratifractor sp.]